MPMIPEDRRSQPGLAAIPTERVSAAHPTSTDKLRAATKGLGAAEARRSAPGSFIGLFGGFRDGQRDTHLRVDPNGALEGDVVVPLLAGFRASNGVLLICGFWLRAAMDPLEDQMDR